MALKCFWVGFILFCGFWLVAFCDQDGFLSLSCGGTANFVDSSNISWTSDHEYINTGNTTTIDYVDGTSSTSAAVRFFPDSQGQTCYRLPVKNVSSLVLVRANFLYKNYDGLNKPPSFSVSLGTAVTSAINLASDDPRIEEFVWPTIKDTILFCLHRVPDGGSPVISSLEIRPLPQGAYRNGTGDSPNKLLRKRYRINSGYTNGSIRYPSDPYDRIWDADEDYAPFHVSTGFNLLVGFSSSSIQESPPAAVLQTARVLARRDVMAYNFPVDTLADYYIVLYFAGILPVSPTFEVLINGDIAESNYTVRSSEAGALHFTWKGIKSLNITIKSIRFYPQVNALEVYEILDIPPETSSTTVSALQVIEQSTGLDLGWQDDPCSPKSWDHVGCEGNLVTSLELSGINLRSISPTFGDLLDLKKLDLHNTSLTGGIQNLDSLHFYNCEPTVLSYNTIMNILVQSGYFSQVHKVYMRMRNKGIVPDVYTFVIRIKSFCRTRRPHVALRLLKNMPSQGFELNAVAYCTVIAGFYEENHNVEAYELFDEMLGMGISPDIATFNKLIHTLCKKGNVRESEKLFNKVLKRGVSPNLFTFNMFIQGLCRKGAISEAISLLDSLGREDLTPDVVTYNTLICGLCKNSKVVEAEYYLHKMVNEGLEPDGFSYNAVIDGYCKAGMISSADKILNDAIFKGFVPDEFTYCSLINGLCQDGDVDHAMAVYVKALEKGLKPSIVLYNTLIKGLSQQGLILQALQLMNEMSESGCCPDMWTYNIVINGLCKMGCVSDANNLVNDAISKGYIPDIFTFNTLIDGYCKQLKMENAIEILNTMWSHGVTPDVITYNSLLNGLCKAAKSEDVMETFKTMIEKRCVPNIITYSILGESLCKAHKITEAFNLLEEVENKGLTLDTVAFGTLINGFCNSGDLDGAYQLFRRMEGQYKISHTTATYNIMINAFSEKLNFYMAEKLFHEMSEKGCPPDNYTYRIMIDSFCKTGGINSGYCLLLENIDKGFIPSLSTIGRVINCLCVDHRVHEAVGIVHLMVQKGIVPEVVNTIFEADKREVASPKIVVEDLLKNSHITYYAYELLFDGIRDKRLLKTKASK